MDFQNTNIDSSHAHCRAQATDQARSSQVSGSSPAKQQSLPKASPDVYVAAQADKKPKTDEQSTKNSAFGDHLFDRTGETVNSWIAWGADFLQQGIHNTITLLQDAQKLGASLLSKLGATLRDISHALGEGAKTLNTGHTDDNEPAATKRNTTKQKVV